MQGLNREWPCAQTEFNSGTIMGSRSDFKGRAASTCRSFECTHPGCNKSFTRAEHLQRHALNHQPSGDSCPKCRAHFKRPDLLKRHMDRHRQKDIEAGGPGCGILDTRKRSWKAPDGSVVDKRPCVRPRPEAQQIPSPESQPSEQSEPHVPNTEHWTQVDQPVSEINWQQPADFGLEGQSNSSFSLNSVSQNEYDFQASLPQQNDSSAFDQSWVDSFDSNLHPNLLSGSMLDVAQLDYDQIFQPDTASSFNMPYTTALDYSWLFDAKGNPTSFVSLPDKQSQFDQGSNLPHPLQSIPTESVDSSQLWPDRRDSHHSSMLSDELDMPQVDVRPTNRSARTASSDVAKANQKAGRRGGSTALLETNEPGDPGSSNETERPFSLLSKNRAIPQVNDQVRKRLLQLAEAANPTLPDSRSLWEEPLLSVKALQEYLNLYFTRFNTAYPLIHLSTFDVNNTEPLLLLSVVLLGATYANWEAHQLAIRIHDVMRPSIFAHAGFSPRPELWALQTILLIECFGKSRAGQKQHDMSHLFHGLLINLIRRSDCQSVRPAGPPSGATDNDQATRDAWRRWSIAEQKKRLALLCFMWDTQHAVLFCQSLCMSAFELRIELPCNQKIWEAGDAISWAAAWRSTPSSRGHFYLPALKSYMTSSVSRPQGLSGLSRVLLLHGLMSIAWDMQRRDQTALGVVSNDSPGGNWRKVIGNAYDAWKSDFDSYTLAVIGWLPRTPGDESQRSEHIAFTTAYNALYHSAQALLNMEFLDIQIYAGTRAIFGRPVQQKDYRRSARNVKQWASPKPDLQDAGQSQITKDATTKHIEQPMTWSKNAAPTAAWHAGRMLRDGTKILAVSDAMSLFHVPWCLYLATLTCWAVHHASPARGRNVTAGDDTGDESSDESDEIVWDPRGEMETLVANMAEMGQRGNTSGAGQRRQTHGLVWTMAEILTKVRWEIVQARVLVLKGLVPQRLINQYDDPPVD